MSLPIVLRDEAQAEFDEAFDYYETRRSGGGVEFAERIQDVFDRLAEMPQMHAVVFRDVRKAVVRKFSYCVYYRAEDERIEVIAVFHTSRNPSIWQERVDKPEMD